MICADLPPEMSGIYKIELKSNGRFYIGSAVSIKRRWIDHRKTLRSNRHRNPKLQRAWNKYGEDSFSFSVLETVVPDQLIAREQHYIDTMCPFFNIAPKAGSMLGFRHTDEAKRMFRQRMLGSKIRLGKPHSIETRQRMSVQRTGRFTEKQRAAAVANQLKAAAARRGMRHTEEARRKISESRRLQKRRPVSDETRRKISESNLGVTRGVGRKMSDEARRKLSLAKMGNKSRTGMRHSEESKRKIADRIRAWHAERREKQL